MLAIVAMDLAEALRADGLFVNLIAALGLAFGAFVLAPRSLAEAAKYDWRSNGFDAMLRSDLARVPRAELDGHLQCIDMAGGCIATLYGLRLTQSTGYLYDCYLFIPVHTEAAKREQASYRADFLAAFERAKPRYVIVTSDECGIVPRDFSYRKIEDWPGFSTLLSAEYRLDQSRMPTEKEGWEGKPVLPYGYRLYHRR